VIGRGALALGAAIGLATLASSGAARAASFGADGSLVRDPAAVAWLDFESEPPRYLPDGLDPKCRDAAFTMTAGDDAMDGASFARLLVQPGCSERLMVYLPHEKASYRATIWARHGALNAQFVAIYQDPQATPPTVAKMLPTGRVTSDGWVELASNDFPVDGPNLAHAYVRISDFASTAGVDVDALEVVPSGDFVEAKSCTGHDDASCGAERQCEWKTCVLPRLNLPPLPAEELRGPVVDVLASQMRLFFGGQRTRTEALPKALAWVESMRGAATASAFWGAWARGVRELHDWHTNADAGIGGGLGSPKRLNACFIEGDADVARAAWPKDPRYADILVSHVGPGSGGLAPGDRLLAVDGKHPIEWAEGLGDTYWGLWRACDPNVHAEAVERLGGPVWGGALMLRYAETFTYVHCDAQSGSCDETPTTVRVADLPNNDGSGYDVYCDNRPLYHLADGKGPDPANHYGLWWQVFRGRIEGTTADEAIFGMAWDSLWGGGDPNGHINSEIANAIADWKAGARGVILDHRAGNGGTLDAATNVTRLVRPPMTIGAFRAPIAVAGFDGPDDAAAGKAIYDEFAATTPYPVGDPGWASDLPVALVLHRDGSASDFMPFGLKGAPNVRIFGPHATAGGFSTFIQFTYWQAMSWQLASGDTIAFDGRALIGHGVEPDEIVLAKQSDLLAGKDTVHEAALAWVRAHLKGAK
jgi:hypothetical protein